MGVRWSSRDCGLDVLSDGVRLRVYTRTTQVEWRAVFDPPSMEHRNGLPGFQDTIRIRRRSHKIQSIMARTRQMQNRRLMRPQRFWTRLDIDETATLGFYRDDALLQKPEPNSRHS